MGKLRITRDTAVEAARLLDEKKAEDILILDIRDLAAFADYMIIATVGSQAQLEAAVKILRERLSPEPLHLEGGGGGWTLIDYGGMVVNLFFPEKREFYALERIWGDAGKVEF